MPSVGFFMFRPCEEPGVAFAGKKPSLRRGEPAATAENCGEGGHHQNRGGGGAVDAWQRGSAPTGGANNLHGYPTSEYVAATRRQGGGRDSEHDGQDSFLYPDSSTSCIPHQSPLNWQPGTHQLRRTPRSERHFGGSPDGCQCHYNQHSQPTTYSSVACKGAGAYRIPLYASPAIAAVSHCVACESFGSSRHAGKRPHASPERCYGGAARPMNLGMQQQCRDNTDPFQQAAEARLISRQEASAESSHAPGHGGSWHWAAASGQMQPPSQRFPDEAYPRHAAAPPNYRSHAAPPGSLQRDPRGHHAYREDLACDELRYHAREVGCEGDPQHHWSPADYRDPAQNAYCPPPYSRTGYPSRTAPFDEFTQSTCTAPKRVKCFLPAPTQTTDEEAEQEFPGQNSTFHPDETSATSDQGEGSNSPRSHGF